MELELELYTPENCVSTRGTKDEVARVSVSKGGKIALNKAAAEKIKWKIGSKIAIDKDPNSENDFYLINVGPAGVGFQVKEDKNKWILLQNAELTKKIRSAVDPECEKTLKFILGKEVKAGKNAAFCMLYKPAV